MGPGQAPQHPHRGIRVGSAAGGSGFGRCALPPSSPRQHTTGTPPGGCPHGDPSLGTNSAQPQSSLQAAPASSPPARFHPKNPASVAIARSGTQNSTSSSSWTIKGFVVQHCASKQAALVPPSPHPASCGAVRVGGCSQQHAAALLRVLPVGAMFALGADAALLSSDRFR